MFSFAPRWGTRRGAGLRAVALALAAGLAACQQGTVAPPAPPVQVSPPQELAAPAPPAQAQPAPAPSETPPPAETPAVEMPETALPAPSAETAPALPPGPASVALLLPLSGPSAKVGQAMFEAAQMALFDVGGETMVLLPLDTGGTPEGAARAAEAAVRDGARLILGPLFSASVAAVAPIARRAGVNVVAFSSDRAVAGPGVYVMGFLPRQQVERVVDFAVARGTTRFAALASAGAYGRAAVAALREATAARGVELVDIAYFPETARTASEVSDIVRLFTNYDARRGNLLAQKRALAGRDDEVARETLRRLETLDTLGDVGFDAVLIPDGGLALTTVAPLLPYYDVDPRAVRILGTAAWETADLASEPALVGAWFAAPPPEARRPFEARFAKLFDHAPRRIATLAYDAVALAGALARMPDGAGFDAAALTNPSGFRGVDGLFRFNPDGSNERGLAVLEVTDEGVKTVGPAPQSFAAF